MIYTWIHVRNAEFWYINFTCFGSVYRVMIISVFLIYLDINLLSLLFVSSSYAISAKKPQNFSTEVWQWFHGQGGRALGANPRNHRVSGVEPQAKNPSNLDKLFYFFSGEGTHILICQKKQGKQIVPPQKKHQKWYTHTQFECEESEDYGRVAGLPIKYFLIFLDDFRTNSIFKGETYCHSWELFSWFVSWWSQKV